METKKIKTPREIMLMLAETEKTRDYADIFNYIDSLHFIIKNYQNLVDYVSSHNEHIEMGLMNNSTNND